MVGLETIIKHLVDISHVRHATEVKDKTVEIIEALSPRARILLVVSLLITLDDWHDGVLSLVVLTSAYNSFASQKGFSTESACGIQQLLDELLDYSMVEAMRRSSTKVSKYLD